MKHHRRMRNKQQCSLPRWVRFDRGLFHSEPPYSQAAKTQVKTRTKSRLPKNLAVATSEKPEQEPKAIEFDKRWHRHEVVDSANLNCSSKGSSSSGSIQLAPTFPSWYEKWPKFQTQQHFLQKRARAEFCRQHRLDEGERDILGHSGLGVFLCW